MMGQPMCTDSEKKAIQKEMEAYDALPAGLKAIFDQCPMKVSVHNTMRMQGIIAAQQRLSVGEFENVLRTHLSQLAARAYKKDLIGV
jgi:hypothetical protein